MWFLLTCSLDFCGKWKFGIMLVQKISGCPGTTKYKGKLKGKTHDFRKNSWVDLGESSRNQDREN